ncbi:MAG TPA: phosphotransferase family protein [Pyrinomonadaceae bacterium]|nr:phosphotransferase family protein [Pyrinomonadaceae bacterium]
MNRETTSVRAGEEISVEGLSRYIESKSNLPAGEVSIEQFPAGSSNLTYLVRIGSEEFVLRRPPFGNTVKTAHDMKRECEVLSLLSEVYQPAPKPVLLCDDDSVIGSQFYLMERRHGLIIRGRAPDELEKSPQLRLPVCTGFIRNLAHLHSLDYKAAGLGDLGQPEGYCRRQVEGWRKRYVASKTHDWIELERVTEWLAQNIPAESGASLVHNDYKFDNLMLDPNDLTKITAVLDWEMVTVGDPLMDLGTTLGYWMSKDAGDEMLSMPFNPRVLMENVSRRELAEIYSAVSGRDVSNILFYYVFGTFKIAVIAQQIYARFVKGFTQDRRFANFDKFVSRLGTIASGAIDRDAI